MRYSSQQDLTVDGRGDEDGQIAAGALVVGALPASVVMCQRAAQALRAWLDDADLPHYQLLHCPSHDLYDIERSLERLGEPAASWTPLPALVRGGQPLAKLTHDESNGAKIWGAGVLNLARHKVVLARWYWADVEDRGAIKGMWLAAAPSAEAFDALRSDLARHRRTNAASFWQVVRGYASYDRPRVPREAPHDLLIFDPIRQRIDREVIGFFNADVAALYRSMHVPYRRGVLLHGPPGNGKTSLIRDIGHRLASIPAMLLRPSTGFDSDDLEEVIRRWSQQAPAIFVIEDLNWLLKEVNVSTFLNIVDGIEGTITGGLLLIATTNHAHELDPAINNRPGRFDVVIEVPCPDSKLRARFLGERLAQFPPALIARLAADTRGLSFAHLQEILRLSGLHAIHAGRAQRNESDLLSAAQAVIASHRHADEGFPLKTEMAFGLLPLRNQRHGSAR